MHSSYAESLSDANAVPFHVITMCANVYEAFFMNLIDRCK